MLLQGYVYEQMASKHDVDMADTVVLTSMVVYGFVVMISAIVLAVKMNPNHPIAMAIVAFLFPELYITQHVFRRYVLGSMKSH